MSNGVVCGVILALLTGSVMGETSSAASTPSSTTKLPPLPAWSNSDSEKLKRGELVAGQDFFGPPPVITPGDLPDIPEGALPKPVIEEPRRDEDEIEIAPEFLARYFEAIPTDADGEPLSLVDPQELLARQEFRDRESFLKYHSGESRIDMFVYLFDARQELPDDLTIEAVYEDLYASLGPTAVIFYHLGEPERAQFLLSREIRAVVSEDEQKRALRAAVEEAFEKSDVAYQLDNFLVELSIRLYWIERELAGAETRPESEAEIEEGALASSPPKEDKVPRVIGRALLFVAIMTGVGLLGWLGHYLTARRIRHFFPEVETGPLLGAPHAAGVGAVVSFSSATLPPSQQRDQVPDYLQRM
ncbi:MAG: hypothetical protein VCA38_19885 [Roseibacillus sp.]